MRKLAKYRGRLAFHGVLSISARCLSARPKMCAGCRNTCSTSVPEAGVFFRLPVPSRATHRSQTYWHSSTQLKAGRASARLKYPKYKIAPSIQRLAVNRPQGVFPAYKRPFDGRFSLREMLLLPTVPIVEERTWSALSARF